MNFAVLLKKAIDRLFLDRFKPLIIHSETIYHDEVWVEIQKEAKKNNVKTWYVMVPLNYDYFKSFFNLKLSRQGVSKLMKERYSWLLAHNQHLELHVHFNKFMDLSYKEQEKIIIAAKNWMKINLGIEPKELLPGWWIYNKDTIKLCSKYNLIIPIRDQCIEIHDYNLLKNRPWLVKEN